MLLCRIFYDVLLLYIPPYLYTVYLILIYIYNTLAYTYILVYLLYTTNYILYTIYYALYTYTGANQVRRGRER